MSHGRQLRLFLADGTSSGPRFFEIFNRTIQALGLPANRIPEAVSSDWPDFQKPGVYLVHGTTEEGVEQLYVGRGENVAKRVQVHPEKLEFEITSLLLFSSKDSNLNGSQVGWLESSLVRAVKEAKRIALTNVQIPELPTLSKPELATVIEFFEDLRLIAQTAGFDFFSPPKPSLPAKVSATSTTSTAAEATTSGPEFILHQPQKEITARGYLSDDGFVVKACSEATATSNDSFTGSYFDLRKKLIDQGVIVPKVDDSTKLVFAIDFAFSAPSPAAAVIVGNNVSGKKTWKTNDAQTLGDYLDSLTTDVEEAK